MQWQCFQNLQWKVKTDCNFCSANCQRKLTNGCKRFFFFCSRKNDSEIERSSMQEQWQWTSKKSKRTNLRGFSCIFFYRYMEIKLSMVRCLIFKRFSYSLAQIASKVGFMLIDFIQKLHSMQFRGFITFVISTMKFDACSRIVAYFITRIEWSWLQILINN